MPFLQRYLAAALEAGFEVRDVENLREHYAHTHRAWRRNLEAHAREIEAEIGQARFRALRLLFSYSTHYFLDGLAEVYQVLLAKPGGTCAPPTLRKT